MPYINLPKPKLVFPEVDRKCEICRKVDRRSYYFYYGKRISEKESSVTYGWKTIIHKRTTYGDLHKGEGRYCLNCIFIFRIIWIFLALLLAGAAILFYCWGNRSDSEILNCVVVPFLFLLAFGGLVLNFRTNQQEMGEYLSIVKHNFRLRKQGYDSFFTETRYEDMKHKSRFLY